MRKLLFMFILSAGVVPAKSQLTWVDLNLTVLQSFNDIDFVSPTVGYMVGKDGKILKTADGGYTWTYQTSTVAVDLFDCEFYDEQTGWACGEGGLVLRTTNGGTTWTPKYILSSDEFHAIDFFSNTTGYVAGKNTSTGFSEIYYTTDGGANFTGIAVPNSISDIADIVFFDLFSGYILIDNTLHYTTNQGFTWVPVTLPTTSNMKRIEMTDFQHGFMVGEDGTILTTSTGTSWIEQVSGTNNTLRGLCIVDANSIFVCGNSTILHTIDGGTNWTFQAPAGLSLLTAIEAFDPETAMSCGEIGRFTRTHVDSDLEVQGLGGDSATCPNTLVDVYVKVKNGSLPPITSGNFKVLNNGTEVINFDWTGNILYDHADEIYVGQTMVSESDALLTVAFSGGDDLPDNNTVDATIEAYAIETYGVNGPFTICTGEEIELTATGGISYLWLNATADSTAQTQVVEPITNANYVVKIMQENCIIMDTVSVTVGSTDCNTNAFSPNDDGTNDFFYIDRLPEGENLVHIFNRWGDPLMTFQNYDNKLVFWSGEDAAGIVTEGVYFYTVESKTSGAFSEGWVQIVR